ncbi:hypothetical protein RV10_GL003760 [Enterococcus pallens]|nr:hypothetical protein RV10_GL003760 [Enterococcus pallens]
MKVPKEIKEYRERIIAGMGWRQLAATAVSLSVTGVLVYFGHFKKGIEVNTLGNVVILTAMPPMAFGFIKVKGMYLEQYAKIVLRYYKKEAIRRFQTNERVSMNVHTKKRFERIKETEKR